MINRSKHHRRLGIVAALLCVVALFGTSLPAAGATLADAVTVPRYWMGLTHDDWYIENPNACDPDVWEGFILNEGRGVTATTYPGTCQGAGIPTQRTGTAETGPAMTFRTNPDFRYPGAIIDNPANNTWVDANGKRLRDRVELQTANWDLPFNADVWVGFQIRIPRGVADVTGSGAFVMQLWQCRATPIAGVRIQSGAGNGHHLQFTRRGDEPGFNYNTAIGVDHVDIGRDEWHSFVVKWHVTPYSSGGSKGNITVYHTAPGSAERLLFSVDEYFGYRPGTLCEGDSYRDKFKLKFGMYKDYQPGAVFRSDFRNVRIGESKAFAEPYN